MPPLIFIFHVPTKSINTRQRLSEKKGASPGAIYTSDLELFIPNCSILIAGAILSSAPTGGLFRISTGALAGACPASFFLPQPHRLNFTGRSTPRQPLLLLSPRLISKTLSLLSFISIFSPREGWGGGQRRKRNGLKS